MIAVDDVPERMAMARAGGAETIDYKDDKLQGRILDMTNGLAPDSVIEAVRNIWRLS